MQGWSKLEVSLGYVDFFLVPCQASACPMGLHIQEASIGLHSPGEGVRYGMRCCHQTHPSFILPCPTLSLSPQHVPLRWCCRLLSQCKCALWHACTTWSKCREACTGSASPLDLAIIDSLLCPCLRLISLLQRWITVLY